MDFRTFLEEVAPYNVEEINGFNLDTYTTGRSNLNKGYLLQTPEIILYCGSDICNGYRRFRGTESRFIIPKGLSSGTKTIMFICKNCEDGVKRYAIYYQVKIGKIYLEKFGELPRFGTRVPKKVLDLFGANEDRDNFLKGRKSEDEGFGIGAFTYYRRVVENKKYSLLTQIIKVCRDSGVSATDIKKIEKAKKEIQFSNAIEEVKDILPESLFFKTVIR